MNFLAKAFSERTPELSKVNLISLYTIASELIENFVLSDREREFGQWFQDFERRRTENRSSIEDERDEDLVDYDHHINQQTASLPSQKFRRELLLKDLLEAMPDLTLIDGRRSFTEEQRITIFRRAGGKCANPNNNPACAIDCDWGNWHADHIVAHSQGGPTSVENGQLLCPNCNLKKAAA